MGKGFIGTPAQAGDYNGEPRMIGPAAIHAPAQSIAGRCLV